MPELLLLSDPVDDFWLSVVPECHGKRFKSVTRGGADLSSGSGLVGMAARVGGVDGRFDLHSPAGGPTTLTIELPHG